MSRVYGWSPLFFRWFQNPAVGLMLFLEMNALEADRGTTFLFRGLSGSVCIRFNLANCGRLDIGR
jgi:hypothetical protein